MFGSLSRADEVVPLPSGRGRPRVRGYPSAMFLAHLSSPSLIHPQPTNIMEDLHQSLDKARLCCLILEADKDAEMAAKDAEKLRASRYRSILAELMGEGDIGAGAANRPQSSGLHLIPWDGSAHPTSRALSTYFARNRLTVTEPQAQPAATITECPGTRTSLPNSNSASHGESESDQNVVRASSSRRTQQTARPVRVSKMTDNQRSAAQTTIRVPSASTSCLPCINDISLAEILTRAGLIPFELTRDELVRVNETRAIPRRTFPKIFGGSWRSEWPQCNRIPGYKNFLCVDVNAQPFVQMAPGKPGLVLRLPTTDSAPRDGGDTFHVFLSRRNLLLYVGEYAKLHHLRVEFDWNDLSHDCKHIWLGRMTGNYANGTVFRTLRARIILRNKFKREPQSTEVIEYLTSRSDHTLPYSVVSAAFRAGEEKLICEAIQCIGYDSNLATIIQRNA